MYDADLCLGCGVCYGACTHGAMHLQPREQRVFTPETTFDRMVAMAIERGKLADLILDNTEGWGYQVLGRVIQVLEVTPPYKAARAGQAAAFGLSEHHRQWNEGLVRQGQGDHGLRFVHRYGSTPFNARYRRSDDTNPNRHARLRASIFAGGFIRRK